MYVLLALNNVWVYCIVAGFASQLRQQRRRWL